MSFVFFFVLLPWQRDVTTSFSIREGTCLLLVLLARWLARNVLASRRQSLGTSNILYSHYVLNLRALLQTSIQLPESFTLLLSGASKNEMSCGSCSQKSSSWKCPITRFTQTFFETTFSSSEGGRALHEPYTLRKPYLNFFTFSTKKKSKVHDLYVNESQGSGSLETGLLHFLYA